MFNQRTEEATRYVDFDRLAISPQCGFAGTVAGNPLTEASKIGGGCSSCKKDLGIIRSTSDVRVGRFC
jgi:hypothetical protein